ncbi:unnamed protein product, partial [Oppiella nova]
MSSMDDRNGKHRDNRLRREPLITNSSLWVNAGETDPMGTRFKIADTDFLDDITERTNCPKCHKSRKYYCYSCYELMDDIRDRVPRVTLPVKVDVIKHVQEVDGKSTSPHVRLIAPQDTTVHTFPDIPDYRHQRVVLVFPAPNARTLKQVFADGVTDEEIPVTTETKVLELSGENMLSERWNVGANGKEWNDSRGVWTVDSLHDCTLHLPPHSDKESTLSTTGMPFDRVVFIDSTWRQTHQILKDPRISPLLTTSTVILSEHESLFWRHQRHSPRTYLSTIEAIYYFFVDLQVILDERDGNCGDYDHRYDNLL